MKHPNLYGMPINLGFIGCHIKVKDFDKAKCPICNEPMNYEYNCFTIRFACDNTRCKGYLKWTGSYSRGFTGRIVFNESYNDLIKLSKSKHNSEVNKA